jgi:hypothetical protein
MGASDPERALELGGPFEELEEWLVGRFETDEWRRAVLTQNAQMLELLQVLREAMSEDGVDPVVAQQRPELVRWEFDNQVTGSDDDIFTSDIEIERAGLLRLVISVDTSTTVAATLQRGSGSSKETQFNSGSSIGTQNVHRFDLPVIPQLTYNYQLGAAANVDYAAVQFIEATN